MPFPSYPLMAHLVHSCGGVAEAQELVDAITGAILPIPIPVSDGGTGVTSFDPNSVLITDGASGLTFAHAGFAGDVFMSTGLTSPPDFITIGGDLLIAGDGTAAIQPHVVTFFQMQQISAHTLLGNSTGSTASVQEITLAKRLAFSSTTLDVVVDAAANLFIGGGGAGVTGNTAGALGVDNIGIGGQSFTNANPFATFLSITDGKSNVGIGSSIMPFLTTGNFNVAIGDLALASQTTGSFNFALGPSALLFSSDGFGNVAIGSGAGVTITHGGQNVLIGGGSDVGNASQNNSIAIGALAKANNANQCVFGSTLANGAQVCIGYSGHVAPTSSDIDSGGQGYLFWDLTTGRSGFRFVGKDLGGNLFSGSLYANVGQIFDAFADVSTTHTNGTFDNIFSTTISNTLVNNGEMIAGEFALATVAHATATRQIKVSFGGTTIYDSTAQATTSIANIFIKVIIIRVSSTVVRCMVSFNDNLNLSGFPGAQYTEVTGLNLSGADTLLVSAAAAGVGAASADIVGKIGTARFMPSTLT